MRVNIEIEVEDVELSLDECFPDGLPDGVTEGSVTAEHVIAAMKSDSRNSRSRLIQDWGLIGFSAPGIRVTIYGDETNSTAVWI